MLKVRTLLLSVSLFLFAFGDKRATTPYKFPKLKLFPKMPEAAYNPVTVEGADLGRHLFYDPILSSDSSMSCSSCHKQQYAFSDSPNTFSEGRNGNMMKRNTMALFNLAWYPALFWDGRAANIEEQVFHPVREYNEMNLNWKVAVKRLETNNYYKNQFALVFAKPFIDSTQVAYAIGQFLRTLISYRSKFDMVMAGKAKFTGDEYEGFGIVNDQSQGDCIHCHITDGAALGTSLVFSNNGLDEVSDAEHFSDKGRGPVTGKISDNGKFIVPSLRNLAFTAPYMHDGRFKTLEEVVDFYSEGVHPCANLDPKMEYAKQGGVKLNAEDKKKVVAFLLTLSDSSFISDPEFSSPYKR